MDKKAVIVASLICVGILIFVLVSSSSSDQQIKPVSQTIDEVIKTENIQVE